MSLAELYGETDLSTNEWADGVLSSLMRSACTGADAKMLTAVHSTALGSQLVLLCFTGTQCYLHKLFII